MLARIRRLAFVGRFVIGAALTVASVLAIAAFPAPLVVAAEGLLFLLLLGWAHVEYESRRRDSPTYRDHLATIKAFAREALDTGLFLEVTSSGRYTATRVINMWSPRARDFRAHFPDVAAQIDEWNKIADGYQVSAARFAGRTHIESEAAVGAPSALSQILAAVGQGHLDPGAISWREEAGRLDASWVLDIDKQPVFQPIASSNLTPELVARVKDAMERFPSTEAAVDWRTRHDAAERLRPALEFALERPRSPASSRERAPIARRRPFFERLRFLRWRARATTTRRSAGAVTRSRP